MKKIKILHVSAHEELIMNYYRFFKSNNIQFDYVLRKGGIDFRFKDDPAFDGKLYYITPMQESVFRWIKELRQIVANDNYSHVHLHLGWASLYGLIACIGLQSCIISHNHSFYSSQSLISAVIRPFLKIFINLLSDHKFACSKLAGQEMFYSGSYILPNAIDYSRFSYDATTRALLLNEFNIKSDNIVFGHVGNFVDQKNHVFLVRIFKAIKNLLPNAKLILVGEDYGTQEMTKQETLALGLEKDIIFTGLRNDVEKVLCAFDVFIFPSLYEGFGMALLEAQVNGLPCLYSSAIPRDGVISEYAKALSLNHDPSVWADEAVNLLKYGLDDQSRKYRILQLPSIYDLPEVAHQLEEFYLTTSCKRYSNSLKSI